MTCRHHEPDVECADCEIAPVIQLPKSPKQWIAELRELLEEGS